MDAPLNKLPPPGIRFPPKPQEPRALALPRRVSPLQRAAAASQATAEARRSIDAIISQSHTPWGGRSALSGSQVEELEKALRALEVKLAEREMALAEAENKLAERERELAETEALLKAREQLMEAMRHKLAKGGGGAASGVSQEEADALKKLKEELEKQEQSLKEAKDALKEREEFLDQSEASLFQKMQDQQLKETELEQKEEDLKRKMRQAGLLKDEPAEPKEKA
jgi:DNA repair exonuclease SbcCD ATPase subunit